MAEKHGPGQLVTEGSSPSPPSPPSSPSGRDEDLLAGLPIPQDWGDWGGLVPPFPPKTGSLVLDFDGSAGKFVIFWTCGPVSVWLPPAFVPTRALAAVMLSGPEPSPGGDRGTRRSPGTRDPVSPTPTPSCFVGRALTINNGRSQEKGNPPKSVTTRV